MSDLPFPHYLKPPVVEVVFAVALGSLPFTVIDLARFGLERLGPAFPIRTEQSPMQVAVETFDRTVQMVMPTLMPTLSLLSGPPPVRLWFQSEDRTRLVQLQRDWLACNWQGTSPGTPYPRYTSNEDFFFQTWDAFSSFTLDIRQSEATPTQCELTYINHIIPGQLWSRHGEINKVIRLAGTPQDFLPEPEDEHMIFRYRIPFEGRDIGRLYVQATSALRPEDLSPVIQLQLTARGSPLGAGRNGMVGLFRLAHEWIVKGFAAVTTDVAQRSLWERKR